MQKSDFAVTAAAVLLLSLLVTGCAGSGSTENFTFRAYMEAHK